MNKSMKPGRGHPASKSESALINSRTYDQYYTRLKNIAISSFEWKNLPPEIDPRFMELALFDTGMAVFYKDDVLNEYVALRTMINGPLNKYNIPTLRRAYASNGYNYSLTDKDSVLIFNDYLHTPTSFQIELFARRLYEIERAIDVNVKGQKFPLLLKSTESQRTTMKNLYMQYDGNEPFIFGDNSLDISGFQAINTNSPFVADKLLILKRQTFNDALTYLGISNSDDSKKERLITDEVSSTLGGVEIQRYVFLNSRRLACEQINRMFGLNVQVSYRTDISFVDPGKNTSFGNAEEVDEDE